MAVNFVCGSTGAGKTTYARGLAAERNAVRFSIDDWMNELYWPDQEPGADYRWALERVERCERRIWAVARDILATGGEVVLDLGFTERRQRDRLRAWAAEADVEVLTHFLDVDAETRRARVKRRNAEKGDTFVFKVTDDMFDFMEGLFEPPTDAEGPLETIRT